jgi:predicted small secreted protein
MSNPFRLVSIFLLMALVLSACNLPPGTQEETGGAGAVLTAAAQTVEVSLTQSAAQNTPTVPVLPTNTTAPPTPTLAVSPTGGAPAATATQDCDKADFVADVTIPDGTALDPNESFTKTWRLRNSGTCSWTPSYTVVFSNGDSMGGPSSQALTGSVNPGQTMDISVNLKAPATDGKYTGYWKLRNAAGVTFATFYVDIKVGDSTGGKFAVTGVNMSVSGGCGNFQIKADITTNGAGTVTYKWVRSDGATDTATHPDLVFDSAGTKSVTTSWSTTASGSKWMDIYIDTPNHQQFGRANFSCP